MIIYTCPQCGGDLVDYVITTYPPIQAKKCLRCGWRWDSQTNPVYRIRFDPGEGQPIIIPESEEVYDQHTDTAGNFRWTGTRSGSHIVREEPVEDYDAINARNMMWEEGEL